MLAFYCYLKYLIIAKFNVKFYCVLFRRDINLIDCCAIYTFGMIVVIHAMFFIEF